MRKNGFLKFDILGKISADCQNPNTGYILNLDQEHYKLGPWRIESI